MANVWMIGTGWLIMMIGVLVGNLTLSRMLKEVNGRLAPADRISPYWWYLTKMQRLWKLHKQLIPDSPLRKLETLSIVIMLVGFCTVATQFFPVAGLNSR